MLVGGGQSSIVAAFAAYLAQGLGCSEIVLRQADGSRLALDVGAEPSLPWRIARGDNLRWRPGGTSAARAAVRVWHVDGGPATTQLEAAVAEAAEALRQAPAALFFIDGPTPVARPELLEDAAPDAADALHQAPAAAQFAIDGRTRPAAPALREGTVADAADGLRQAPAAALFFIDDGRLPPLRLARLEQTALLEHMLAKYGLEASFVGATPPDAASGSRPGVLAVVESASTPGPPPPAFKVLAIVPAFNEADIIDRTIAYLVNNGMDVYLLDNWSTDATLDIAYSWLGRGLLGIEQFPPGGPDSRYDLRRLLGRVEEIACETPADWYVLHDADERRESPWPGLSLREALWRVDRRGYSCIDHVTLNFWPTSHAEFDVGMDLATQLPSFEFSTHAGHFHQRRGWKNTAQRVALAASAGHDVQFAGRLVEPFKFLQRHYPVRSQSHGERKVLRERMPRFAQAERAAGWHAQYDEYSERSFVRDPEELVRFDCETFYDSFMIQRLSSLGAFQQPPDWATPMR